MIRFEEGDVRGDIDPRLGPCDRAANSKPMLIRVVTPEGVVDYYKVYESEGPKRYGWYPQRGSMNAFWQRHHFEYPGHIAFIDGLEDLPPLAEWTECKNIWRFYKHIGFSHKTKKFTKPSKDETS